MKRNTTHCIVTCAGTTGYGRSLRFFADKQTALLWAKSARKLGIRASYSVAGRCSILPMKEYAGLRTARQVMR